ncbi:hypothetical protein IFM89_016246 [Coptis chinensis]|uniref:Glucose-6-phosphate isomerase n=1 Tax=Coptis chinensis TaxID=261450 RepID=A0A835M3K0_9MAGN|nr:hypothetical protein IFM89_016246 [Coptis chinensis]
MASSTLICNTEPWKDLKAHVDDIKKTHLRDLMNDADRCKSMIVEFDGLVLDYSRQRAFQDTIDKLLTLAEINSTEDRSVLHVALRAPRDKVISSDGKNVVPEVWKVLDKINEFSERVRSGSWVGATGKALKDVVAVGIGGSFLGPLFVHTALQTDPEAIAFAKGRQLRFLANVDPIDVARSITGLNPETTLVVVVSKTFTTAETMLNARTLREWISAALGPQAVAKHMVAVSTNLTLVEKFGIDPNNAFAFWDWVGGRYSVCSAVGVLPLSLQYGFSVVEKFLKGASSIDQHFYSADFEKNIPVLLGLLSVWNVSFLGYPARAILPYSQALEKFAPHIQQVSMESNGKGVSIDGVPLPFEAGEIDFGEPGTNGQHSFYQLIHQGRVIPCDFIGVAKSQQPVYLKGEMVSNHDELMSNFFAQPDALAYGKSLASQVRKQLNVSRTKGEPVEGFNYSTTTLMTKYLEAKSPIPSDPTTVKMSVAELKERHLTATTTVNGLRDRLRQKRLLLLDTDVSAYAKNAGRSAVSFGQTDLVCCRTLQGHTGKVYSLDWTPEKNRIVSASQDGRLIVWNALTSQKTHAIKLPCAWVMTCAFSPSGQSVASGGLDSLCTIFNLNSPIDRDGNLPVSRLLSGHKGYVTSCQYVPDEDTHLITSSGDQTCVLWDVTTGQRISVFGGEFPSGHTADVLRVAYPIYSSRYLIHFIVSNHWWRSSPALFWGILCVSINRSNSKMFVSGSCDTTARLWDTRIASRAVRTYHGHNGDVNTVKFFPDGQRFGTGSDDGTCRLFDMRTGHELQVYYQQHGDNDVPTVTSIAFSISGRLMFVGYSNGDCYVWDTLVAEVVLNLGSLQNSHEGRITCLGMSTDGSALCTGSWDKNLKIWAFGGYRNVVSP